MEKIPKESSCPQCNRSLNLPSLRLVQDSCGHKKCRMCLLQDESQCRMCLQRNAADENSVNKDKKSVIKYENNHTAVITCNKFKYNASIEQPKLLTVVDNATLPCNTENDNKVVDKVKSAASQKDGIATKANKAQDSGQKRAYNSITLPNHVTITTENPLTYKCNICNKSFRTKSHIRYHSYCAGGMKPFQCKECHKEFISKYHLETHRLNHSQKKQYVCDICKKNFSRLGKLNRHKLVHADLKQFVCQQCGKMFACKEYLQRHNIIHTAEKPFACSVCKVEFNSRSNLNKHRLTHSKEKMHMCDECGKRFKLKGALTVHRRSHSRLRSHVCNDCSKTFINAKELHRHQLIHLDAKNYACSLCGISFRRKDNLQRHIRNTHPGKKATLIKKPAKRIRTKQTLPETRPENPNAIKVITAPPPPPVTSATETEPILSKPVPVINAPLKLAFKTTAFKSHYNIHSREYVEPPRIHPKSYDYAESVSICQKILSPNSPPPPRTIIKTLGNVSEKESTEICQKILSPIVPPIINDAVIEKAHSIRNIKFKLPSKYINLSKKNIFNDITTLKPVEHATENPENVPDKNSTYTELKPVQPLNGATSVIVNSQSTSQNEMHWRRRTLQNLELQSKHAEN